MKKRKRRLKGKDAALYHVYSSIYDENDKRETPGEPVSYKDSSFINAGIKASIPAGQSHMINALLTGWAGSLAVHVNIVQLDTSTSIKGNMGPVKLNLTQSDTGSQWTISGTVSRDDEVKNVNLNITGARGSRHIRGWIDRRHMYFNENTIAAGILTYEGAFAETSFLLEISDINGNVNINGVLKPDNPVSISIKGSRNPEGGFLEYSGFLPALAYAVFFKEKSI